MNNKKGGGDPMVQVKKSGITELLSKIKELEQEVVTKNKLLLNMKTMEEIKEESYEKKIKTLESELQITKKTYEKVDEDRVKAHQAEVKKLETELVVKSKFTDMLSADLSGLRRQLNAKEKENQLLRAQMTKLTSQKSNDQNAQSELFKIKQNLTKLQGKLQKTTQELNKYNAVPCCKDILSARDLVSKVEEKVSKTKIAPENIHEIEEKRQFYKAEVEKRKAKNKKLLENLKSNGVLTRDYRDEAMEKLETQIQNSQQQAAEDIQTKLKKIYEIAQLTTGLSAKLNNEIPQVIGEVIQSIKARDDELNGLRNTSYQKNFNNQEKKYKELMKKLDDEKDVFESLLRNVPKPNEKPKNATGRAEDLLKSSEAASTSSTSMQYSLIGLKEECDALYKKYYGEEIGLSLERAQSSRGAEKSSGPTGWTFDVLDNKEKKDDY